VTPIRVLYVEDDERLARLVAEYLRSHDLEVHLEGRGELVVASVLRLQPDVVLLDLNLPGLDGLEVCRQLRARSAVPILMVTARGETADRIGGLDGGADDYLTKPFQSRELLARIRAVVRRVRGEVGPRSSRLAVGGLVVDTARREATLDGVALALTQNEFAVVCALAQRAGRVMSREELLQVVHGSAEEAFDRSIDIIVSRLRAKLGDDPRQPRMLKTIRGAGYLLTRGEP
jgi:DNA-binding response OmpR family regulator